MFSTNRHRKDKKKIPQILNKSPYSLSPDLPKLNEIIIGRGSFWCSGCFKFNAETKNQLLRKGRGIVRVFCNWCGLEDTNGVLWKCPQCNSNYSLKEEANAKTFINYFCTSCFQTPPWVEISYPNHYELTTETQNLWLKHAMDDSREKSRKILKKTFTQSFTRKMNSFTPTEILITQLLQIQNSSNSSNTKIDLVWNSKINIYYRNENGENLLKYTMCLCLKNHQISDCIHKKLAFWLVSHGVRPYYTCNDPPFKQKSPWPTLIFPFFHNFLCTRDYNLFLIWNRKMFFQFKKHYLFEPKVFTLVSLFLFDFLKFSHLTEYSNYFNWLQTVEKMFYQSHFDVKIKVKTKTFDLL